MADELGAELSLDFDDARRELAGFGRDIEDELERAATSFGDAYERAVGGLPVIEPEIDTDPLTTELERAIQSTDTELTVTGNVDELQSEVADALASTHPAVEIDTDPMVEQIEGLFDSFHPEITPEIDTTAIQSSLDELTTAAGGISDLGEGFDEASDEAEDFDNALKELNKSAGESSDSLGNVSNVSTTLATAFSAAKGDGRQLISQIGQLSPALGKTLGPAAALTAGFVGLFAAGQRSLASTERAVVVLGDAAARIETIDVGGLEGSLGDLAVQAGVSGGALRQAATNAAQMGLQSGKSKAEVTDFANKVNALALRAVALNPALGEAGSVAERLNLVLGRGGRFLNRYQLDLTSAEITMRALADTGKTSARDLTSFERSVAGADIAVEKLGNTLGTDFQRGAEQTAVQMKSIRAELNSAFARAGKPLVEPTVEALHSLADAGAGVSEALGELGASVIPPVAAGLKTLGTTAGVVADAFSAIPAPVIAAGAAALLLRTRVAGLVETFTTAAAVSQTASGQLVFPGLETATGRLSRYGAGIGAVAKQMDTFGGRAVVALGALTALDAGLGALGTSTEELGIQFITTGAALGFAFGGPTGAGIGAGVGALAQFISIAVSAQGELQKATAEVADEFAKAEATSGDLRAALFAQATTALGLAGALDNLDANMAEFVLTSSSFKGLKLVDDLRRLGFSAEEVGRLAQEGDAGLAKFVARAQKANEVGTNVARAVADSIQIETGGRRNLDEEVSKNISKRIEEGGVLKGYANLQAEVEKRLGALGVSARLTGVDFAALSKEQQRNVLAVLREQDGNTKLLAAFQTLQKQIRATEHAQFDLFASTTKLSPAIIDAAKAAARGGDGTIDWVKALRLLSDAARGVLPELGNLTAETFRLQREFSGVTKAIDGAVQSLPSLGSALSKALDSSFFDDLFGSGQPFLDTEKLLGNLNKTNVEINDFFTDIQTITEAGAGQVAEALLALGPDSLGARVAADLAANEPLFRDGMEKALAGINGAILAQEATLNQMRARINFLALAQNTPLEEQLKKAFEVSDISLIQTPQLVAFAERFGTLGSKSFQEFVDAWNREQVSKKLIGFDTKPVEEGIERAKEALRGANFGQDIDIAMQEAQAAINRAAEPLPAPIPQALQDIQPEVLGAVGQIGEIITTGTVKTKEEYDAEFKKIVGLTKGTLGETETAVRGGVFGIATAAAQTVSTAIESQLDNAFNKGTAVGANITYGIAAGIGSDAAARAAQEEIDRQLDALQAEANQHIGATSPAKAFIPTGRYIVQGVAVGIDREDSASAALRNRLGDLMSIGAGGFGRAPVPAGGVGLMPTAVTVDLSGVPVGSSSSSDINVYGGIHNYGPDPDVRGSALVRHLRDLQVQR